MVPIKKQLTTNETLKSKLPITGSFFPTLQLPLNKGTVTVL